MTLQEFKEWLLTNGFTLYEQSTPEDDDFILSRKYSHDTLIKDVSGGKFLYVVLTFGDGENIAVELTSKVTIGEHVDFQPHLGISVLYENSFSIWTSDIFDYTTKGGEVSKDQLSQYLELLQKTLTVDIKVPSYMEK
jgi:hypothetical protein